MILNQPEGARAMLALAHGAGAGMRHPFLEALAAGVRSDLNILRGWRYEEFGKDALDLVEGRLAFAIENGKLKMSRVVKEQERVDA